MRFIYIIRSAVTFVGLNKPAQVSNRKVDSLHSYLNPAIENESPNKRTHTLIRPKVT